MPYDKLVYLQLLPTSISDNLKIAARMPQKPSVIDVLAGVSLSKLGLKIGQDVRFLTLYTSGRVACGKRFYLIDRYVIKIVLDCVL